jgi:hypothetical protein
MIRGNIEVVTPESIQGWIYTEDRKIREKLLLAFWGDQCVGSGKVSVFRSDLADAGLGDGHLGFSFPITVQKDSVGSVVIRIDGSDAVLLQTGASVESGSSGSKSLDQASVSRQLAALKWALKHCRISQADFDFLRILWSFGIYERGLLRRNEHGETTIIDSQLAIASSLLESYLGMDAEIATVQGVHSGNFKEHMMAIAGNNNLAPVVALSSKGRAVVQILEGSHVAENPASGNSRGSTPTVHYTVSPENLVIIDSRVTAELSLTAGKSIEILTASASFI